MQLMHRFCWRARRRGVRPRSFRPKVERLEIRRLLAAGWPGAGPAEFATLAEGESAAQPPLVFDFGTADSPVRLGMQRVTPSDRFGPEPAHGLLPDSSSLTARDRQRWGDHSREPLQTSPPAGDGGDSTTDGDVPADGDSCPTYDPTAADADWVSIFPDSEAPLFEPEQHIISCSSSYTAGTKWGSLDERQVFAKRVSVYDPDGVPEYEFRIGKGSQLYSLRMADNGGWHEAIATQRAGRAEWIDEVIQTVIVDRETNDRSSESTKNQLHQAGTYENISGVGTFYSPVLKEAWLPEERAFVTLSWPQQAHVPSNFKSRFLLMQKVRDLGSGVLEVTYIYHNFSQEGEKADFLASPWLPLRNSTLPLQYRSLPDGTLQRDQRVWPSGTPVPIVDTGGYFLAASGSNPDDVTLGIVFGTDENPAGQSSPTRFRWGRVDQAGRDLTAASVQKTVLLEPGDAFFQRYYLVTNSLQNTRAIAQQLVPHVDQGYLSQAEEHLVDICLSSSGEITTACSGEPLLVQASLVPRPGLQPLLVARRQQDGRMFVTNDPYLLARRPYLQEYEYHGLLGWVTGQQLHQLAAYPDPVVQNLLRLAVVDEDPGRDAITIDIRPGRASNPINPLSAAVTKVALISTDSFDATAEILPETLAFGATGGEDSLARDPQNSEPVVEVKDVDGDGRADLVASFLTAKTGFQASDAEGVLHGETAGGAPIGGTDAVRIVPGRGSANPYTIDDAWNNWAEPTDVNDDGKISALDALLVINALYQRLGGQLPTLAEDAEIDFLFLDTSGNGELSALDALLVINQLNRQSQLSVNPNLDDVRGPELSRFTARKHSSQATAR